MSSINTMIVDDEEKSIEILSLLLNRYHKDVQIVAVAHSMKEALPIIEKYKDSLDILFLDIQMSGGDGFTLLSQIQSISFRIIFTTAYDEFAIRAFKFSALDYLLKPIDNAELTESLDRYRSLEKNPSGGNAGINDFREALRQRNVFEKLAVTTMSEVKLIPISAIVYLESKNNYTTIHLANREKVVASKNIGYYEDLLKDSNFFRIHNSFLVNLDKVQAYRKGKSGSVKLENGAELAVSLRRKEQLMKLLRLE